MVKIVNDRIAGGISLTDVHWVLTVPAIWTEAAKQFMVEALVKVRAVLFLPKLNAFVIGNICWLEDGKSIYTHFHE